MTLDEARHALATLAATAPAAHGGVTLSLDGPIAELRIDNPRAANAITVGMMVDLADAVAALEAWPGSVVVVEAAGDRAFCGGGHLGQVRSSLVAPGAGERMARAMTTVLDRLLALPVVSIAAVTGPALGGGAELLTAVDHVVIGQEVTVRWVQAHLGIAPGWGGAARLAARVGRASAVRLLTTAEPVGADRALAMGLVDRVDAHPREAAHAWAARVAHHPPGGVRAAKAQVVSALAGHRDAEATWFASVWGGPAHLRALGVEDDP